jgi:hypothetical protein
VSAVGFMANTSIAFRISTLSSFLYCSFILVLAKTKKRVILNGFKPQANKNM